MITYVLNKLRLLKWFLLKINIETVLKKEKIKEKDIFYLKKILSLDDYKNDKIFIDCGANVGLYTGLLHEYINDNSEVYSFEPRINVYNILKDRFNEFSNIKTEFLAVSDKNTSSEICLNASHAKGSLSFKNKDIGFSKQPVYCIKLDSYFSNIKNHRKISFLKIDVEGHEINVLKGAYNILKFHKPIVLCEIEERHHIEGTFEERIFSYMKELGYKAFYYCHKKDILLSTHTLVQSDSNSDLDYIFNYWFLHESTNLSF